MKFEIGEVPNGWRRGDKLRVFPVIKYRPGHRGAFLHAELGSPGDPVPEIGAVEFTADMLPKVNAWLDWWRGKDGLDDAGETAK